MVKHGTGNWQARHEKLEARRRAAKLRKQQSQDDGDAKYRRKQQFHECFERIVSLSSVKKEEEEEGHVHLWIKGERTGDSGATAGGGMDHFDADQVPTKPTRPRSVSLSEPPTFSRGNTARLGRGRRSQSFGEGGGGKAVHPRSKEQPQPSPRASLASGQSSMCRRHFFTAKCGRSKRKCMWGHVHIEEGETLCRHVSHPSLLQEAQMAVSTAAAANDDDEPVEAMPALHAVHYPLLLVHADADDMNKQGGTSVSDWLQARQLNVKDIVYMVYQGVLVYDAHQNDDANLLAHAHVRALVTGETEPATVRTAPEDVSQIAEALPAIILQHILEYLPDEAVASFCQVCSSWHGELWESSSLWTRLLERRQWPHTLEDEEDEDEDGDTTSCSPRVAFLLHYGIWRDLQTLHSGMEALQSGKPAAHSTKTQVAIHPYTTTSSPLEVSSKFLVQTWSPGRILIGDKADCSLSLYETVTKADGSGEKHCRQLLSHSMNVYRHTKRKESTLVAMTIADDSVACLTRSYDDSSKIFQDLLLVTSRDDFLTQDDLISAGTQDDAKVHIINTREALLNYLVTLDDKRDIGNHGFGLLDYLASGGSLDQLRVCCSNFVGACGSHNYLLEASISCPSEDGFSSVIDRRLFVISTSFEAIVWVGDCASHVAPFDLPGLPFWPLDLHLSASKDSTCTFAISHAPSFVVGHTHVSTDGVLAVTPPKSMPLQITDTLSGTINAEMLRTTSSQTAIGREYFLTAQVTRSDAHGDIYTFVTLYQADQKPNPRAHANLLLKRVKQVRGIVFSKDEKHAILLCDSYQRQEDTTWIVSQAIVLYLADLQEIFRVDIPLGKKDEVPLLTLDFDTLTAAYGNGLVMAGPSIREAPVDASMRTTKKREKSKRRRHGKKKDGFQRGSSLFG